MTDKGREASMKTRNSTSANAWHKLGSPRARCLLVLAIILLPCLALAQVPLIQQVSPPSVVPGSGLHLLHVLGANFDPSTAQVMEVSPHITGSLSIVSASPTELVANYLAPIGARPVYITVVSKGLTSNAIPLPITSSGPVDFGNTQIQAGKGPQSIALGDFNNDGNLDMAIVNSTDNTVSILLSNGDGTFTGPAGAVLPPGVPAGYPPGPSSPTYKVGHNPQFVVAGDFNNDGKLDLAVANENDNTISILLGNGNGTFQPQTLVTLPGNAVAPVGLAVADFDLSGALGFAVVNQTDSNCPNSGSDGSVYTYKNSGSPSFTFSVLRSTCVGILPTSVVTADFDGDGKPDLVVVNEGGGNATCPPANGTVTFVNNGGGNNSYCAGQGPSAAAVGYFNNDNVLDLVLTSATSAQITYLEGSGTGGGFKFLTPATFPAGGLVPNSIVVGDRKSGV